MPVMARLFFKLVVSSTNGNRHFGQQRTETHNRLCLHVKCRKRDVLQREARHLFFGCPRMECGARNIYRRGRLDRAPRKMLVLEPFVLCWFRSPIVRLLRCVRLSVGLFIVRLSLCVRLVSLVPNELSLQVPLMLRSLVSL